MTQLVLQIDNEIDVPKVEKRFGLKLRKNSPVSKVVFVADVTDSEAEATVQTLNESPMVTSAEVNHKSMHVLAD